MMNLDRLTADGRLQYGWMRTRPRRADPLEGARSPLTPLRRTRLKEWLGIFIAHPEWSAGFLLNDAKYLTASDFHAYHWPSDTLITHAASGGVRLPANLLDATASAIRPGYDIRFAFGGEGGTHRITIDVAADENGPAVRGELTLDGATAPAPLSVSERLPRGSMFTWKQAFPVSGTLRVGEQTIDYLPSRDLALVDEHRSLLPYRTDWDWGTFAFPTDDGIVGANFVSRPHRDDQRGESAVWADGGCEPLGAITFAPSGDDPLAPWTITSDDGRLDVEFTPQRRKPTLIDYKLVVMDYFMMYGSYRGVLRAGGRSHDVRDVHGTCERMHARL